ncbi:hypothetical protein C8F04DRAFT_1177840 [Mycena alexandri]|uniref:Uncharacterized protein n=1 Tax=Mycena alexandri TaxID=1745969 RepID=A0AAD6X672_9AGAR|nr:hypothetical protein C8F04DRAFT_1177840 [Mycena alexandri]
MAVWLWAHGLFALSPLPLRLVSTTSPPTSGSSHQRPTRNSYLSPHCFLQGFNSRPHEGFAEDSQPSWSCRTPRVGWCSQVQSSCTGPITMPPIFLQVRAAGFLLLPFTPEPPSHQEKPKFYDRTWPFMEVFDGLSVSMGQPPGSMSVYRELWWSFNVPRAVMSVYGELWRSFNVPALFMAFLSG